MSKPHVLSGADYVPPAGSTFRAESGTTTHITARETAGRFGRRYVAVCGVHAFHVNSAHGVSDCPRCIAAGHQSLFEATTLTPGVRDLFADAVAAGYKIQQSAPANSVTVWKGRSIRTNPSVKVFLTETGGFHMAHRADVDLSMTNQIPTMAMVRKILAIPFGARNGES